MSDLTDAVCLIASAKTDVIPGAGIASLESDAVQTSNRKHSNQDMHMNMMTMYAILTSGIAE
ncbi:hypothetical protein Taro_006729 [Colocasia esculenta]|uniref:Uncharacterized protein n=1 Tax=Colocasia esculenta TaxID=4460 RepID=A0A843TYH6_COLES|nr:hypothetical protein [Colocasia esculenta]